MIAQIDCEIRQLVTLLNQIPGIKTDGSCAGHREEEQAYISFTASDQKSVAMVLQALPFLGMRGGFVQNQPELRSVWLSLGLRDANPWYTLHVEGKPAYVRRQLLGELESAIERALPVELRPLCSNGGADHNEGTILDCPVS